MCYENLISNLKELKGTLQKKDIDNCLKFTTLFQTDDINLFLIYEDCNKKYPQSLSKRIDTYIQIACHILDIEQIDGNEKEIVTFFLHNLIENGKAYHLTSTANLESIQNNGLNPNAKANYEIDTFFNKLNSETKKNLFPLKVRDDNYWFYSVKPITNSANYGNCPEWFYFLTSNCFGIGSDNNSINNCEVAIKYTTDLMTKCNESIENKKEASYLIRKYWSIYENAHLILVMAPLTLASPKYKSLKEFNFSILNSNNLSSVLRLIIERFSNAINCKSKEIISPDDLEILDMNTYALISKKTLNK